MDTVFNTIQNHLQSEVVFSVLGIEIRRPKMADIEELHVFFREVITDTFAKEGLSGLVDSIEEEIESKKLYLSLDLQSHGLERFFLLACLNNKVVGTIEYGPPNQLITSCTNGVLQDSVEIGTVFVLPNYQRLGIGNLLLHAMYSTLQNKGIDEFCLDSGYIRAQHIWKKKFGEPDFVLKDYWGKGNDHMIWRRHVQDVI